jgi:hypothetical protein
MEYVMVPVPEEIVDEVRAFLAWDVSGNTATPDNPEAIVGIYESSDAVVRAVLSTVAAASLDGFRPPLREVAETAGVNIHELIGVLADMNHRLRDAGGPMAAIMMRPDHRPRPDGVTEWEHRVMHMPDPLAKLVVDL